MKLCNSSSNPRRAVALVVTLILLSVILVVTVALLAISRRERSSVNTAQQLIDAEFMANSGLERAKAVVASRILGYTNMAAGSIARPIRWPEGAPGPGLDALSGHDGGNLIVSTSTNSINPFDYTPAYLASLHFDPRPPVFIQTNFQNQAAPLDFRYFLDLNRNGQFESNGFFRWLDTEGKPVGTRSNWHSGDPEWIGVLENPAAPHSSSNRFVGRYAFLVVPAGRALDINSIHNNARHADLRVNFGDGFMRHQGVGTYEINLAAFLADLNVNYWSTAARPYSFDLPPPYGKGNWIGSGVAFDEARALLKYRYAGDQRSLPTLDQWFGNDTALRINSFLTTDFVDWYSDDAQQTIIDRAQGLASGMVDEEAKGIANSRWPGVESPNRFHSINDFFKAKSGGINQAPFYSDFSRDLLATSTNRSTYDRYTYYRLLSQMSTDAGGAGSDRIHLRFKNTEGTNESEFVPWTPTEFFNTVADRLIKETFVGHHTNDYFSASNAAMRFSTTSGPLPGGTFSKSPVYLTNLVKIDFLSVTNIPIYPTNYYNVALHRLLQVTANLYEANNSSRPATVDPTSTSAVRFYPTLYRPLFQSSSDGEVIIAGYKEDDGLLMAETARWKTIPELAKGPVTTNDIVYVYGIPPIVAARKGFPSLNEVSLVSFVDVARKLLITKSVASENLREKLKPSYIREMPLISITNIFAVEMLNAYTSAYPRKLELQIAGRLGSSLFYGLSNIAVTSNIFLTNITYTAKSWSGGLYATQAIRVPLVLTNVVTAWATFTNGVLNTNVQSVALFGSSGTFSPPLFSEKCTNELRLLLVDADDKRVVDIVSLSRLETPVLNVFPAVTNYNEAWLTNYDRYLNLPSGVYRQIQNSLGDKPVPTSEWKFPPGWGELPDSEKQSFRDFYEAATTKDGIIINTNLAKQAPWTVHSRLYQVTSWQVNDPLVHYMVDHLRRQSDKTAGIIPAGIPSGNDFAQELPSSVTNGLSNLTEWNIGRSNVYVTRWGKSLQKETQPDLFNHEFNITVKDPLVITPDNWNFPTNPYPSLGDIGSVHRGTPWQTIFLKAATNVFDEGIYQQTWLEQVGSDVAHMWRSDPLDVSKFRTSYLAHPTNDWLLLDYLKVTPSPQAEAGAIGVNQDGLAAWSAVLSGIVVLTNAVNAADVAVATNASFGQRPIVIQPALSGTISPVAELVAGINSSRVAAGGLFQSLGQVLSVPALTTSSPFLNRSSVNLKYRSISEEACEAIPRRIASLVRMDQPRYEIYAYGQALQPAPDSLIKNPLDPNYNLCTNYQVVAEMNTRTVLRFENLGPRPVPSTLVLRTNILKPIVEKFQSLSED